MSQDEDKTEFRQKLEKCANVDGRVFLNPKDVKDGYDY
jgi:hypothetical protein